MFFCISDSRKILLPMIVSHIHFHLSQKQEMKTCADILGPVLTALQIKAVVSHSGDHYGIISRVI